MLIGVVTSSYPRTAGDPAGSFVHGMSCALARRGHEVEVVCPEPAADTDWSFGADWLGGTRVFPAPYARPRSAQRLFWEAGGPDNLRRGPWLAALAPGAVLSLARHARLRSQDWEAMISHWLVPSSLAAAAVRRRADGAPRHLAIAHSGDVHLLRKLPGGRALARLVARNADVLGVVTNQLGGELSSLLGRTGFSPLPTPMGIDLPGLRSLRQRDVLRQELGIGDGLAVLFMGRLVRIKGVDVLIEALAGAGGITLLIAGDGPERGRLEALADRLGVQARFAGVVDPGRRAELLAAADMFVLPSRVLPDGRHEGLPLALIEAMATGLPVVATSAGGVPELVEDGVSGLLVTPGDAHALAEALLRLVRSPELRCTLGAAARSIGAARDWDALVPLYESLLTPAHRFGLRGSW